jgi:hypothetical protein
VRLALPTPQRFGSATGAGVRVCADCAAAADPASCKPLELAFTAGEPLPPAFVLLVPPSTPATLRLDPGSCSLECDRGGPACEPWCAPP